MAVPVEGIIKQAMIVTRQWPRGVDNLRPATYYLHSDDPRSPQIPAVWHVEVHNILCGSQTRQVLNTALCYSACAIRWTANISTLSHLGINTYHDAVHYRVFNYFARMWERPLRTWCKSMNSSRNNNYDKPTLSNSLTKACSLRRWSNSIWQQTYGIFTKVAAATSTEESLNDSE